MKNQNQDKATARPLGTVASGTCGQACCYHAATITWKRGDCEFETCSEHTPNEVCKQLSAEHAALEALEAVAEAAEWLYSAERAEREALKVSSASRCQHQIANRKDAHAKYLTCRANLAAVREGGAK